MRSGLLFRPCFGSGRRVGRTRSGFVPFLTTGHGGIVGGSRRGIEERRVETVTWGAKVQIAAEHAASTAI